MIRRRIALLALGIGVLLGVTLSLLVSRMSGPDPILVRKTKALDQFCRATRMSLDTVVNRLESGDASSQEIVSDMIFHDTANHGSTSVRLCIGDETPPPMVGLTLCHLNKDYACIAKHARAYRDALVSQGW